jgi:hypothetical protein
MKACKIILIILYVLSCIFNLVKVGMADGDEQLKVLLTAILEGVVYGILYAGAGIFSI